MTKINEGGLNFLCNPEKRLIFYNFAIGGYVLSGLWLHEETRRKHEETRSYCKNEKNERE
jgi:hypothetical protein